MRAYYTLFKSIQAHSLFCLARLLHPSDPAPTFDGKDVYPITTFLSKLPATKCNVCDRDPATRITLHDELAGVSPCYICDFCFKCFHEDEDGARENGVEIIPCVLQLTPCQL